MDSVFPALCTACMEIMGRCLTPFFKLNIGICTIHVLLPCTCHIVSRALQTSQYCGRKRIAMRNSSSHIRKRKTAFLFQWLFIRSNVCRKPKSLGDFKHNRIYRCDCVCAQRTRTHRSQRILLYCSQFSNLLFWAYYLFDVLNWVTTFILRCEEPFYIYLCYAFYGRSHLTHKHTAGPLF